MTCRKKFFKNSDLKRHFDKVHGDANNQKKSKKKSSVPLQNQIQHLASEEITNATPLAIAPNEMSEDHSRKDLVENNVVKPQIEMQLTENENAYLEKNIINLIKIGKTKNALITPALLRVGIKSFYPATFRK